MIESSELIKRLRALPPDYLNTYSIINTFMGGTSWNGHDLRKALVELIKRTSTTAWLNEASVDELSGLRDDRLAEIGLIRLPVDADGEAILPGDQLEGVSDGASVTVRDLKYSGWLGWTVGDSGTRGMQEHGMYVPHLLRHHRTTVNEVLNELEGMCRTGNYEAAVERCADLARTLRELLEEGES